jgi:acyl-CoA synthetase (AMP-forming)/AMP-acid ligase II
MSSLTIGDLYDRAVQYHGKSIAITFKNQSYTYDEMGANANRLVNGFRTLGLSKGDKVAFLMANCPEYVFCEYAVAKTGCIRIPLAVLLSTADHIYMVNQSGCKALVYHEKMRSRVKEMIPLLKTVTTYICVSEDPETVMAGHVLLQSLLEENSPGAKSADLDPEDLAGIYYTGGTTGKPKGVMLSHRAWVNTILFESLEFELKRQETFAYLTPLTHAGGCLLLPVLLKKGRCVILDHFDPKIFLETVEKQKITSTFLVPTMIYVLLDYPELGNYDLSSLSNVIYGASAIAPERLKQAVSRFGPIFTQLFGQTEAPMTFSVLTRDEHVIADPEREKKILSSAGRPTFHTQLRILDENGDAVKPGEPGEVVIKCTNMMTGYLENPDATKETIKAGWLYTGDIAKQDAEGYLYIVDRKKDMIISGGFNIYPREIEDVLFEHPFVKDAAVIGVPHDKWGEQVKALVVLREGAKVSPEEIIAFVKEKKGSLVAPKSVAYVDKIPLTNVGKVDKKKLRKKYWKGTQRMIS